MVKKTTLDQLGWMILVAPFLRANGLQRIMPVSTRIYDIWALGAIAVLLLKYMKETIQRKKTGSKKIDWPVISCVLFAILILIPTIIYHGDVLLHLRVSFGFLGVVLSVTILRNKPRILIKTFYNDLEILIYLNAISMVVFPKGWTIRSSYYYIMGYDNHWFVFYYAAFYFAILNYKYLNNHFRSLLLIAVLHITAIYTMSGVLVFGALLFDVILLFRVYKKKYFTTKNALIISLVVSLLFIFASQWEPVQYFINNIYGQTRAFSKRLNIWGNSFLLIRDKFFFGNGRRYSADNQMYFGSTSAVNSHNHWVEILLEGGVVGFIAFIVMVLFISNPKRTDSSDTDSFYRISVIPLFVMFMAMSMDSMQEIRGVMLFCIISMGYYSDEIQSELSKQVQQNKKKRIKLKWHHKPLRFLRGV